MTREFLITPEETRRKRSESMKDKNTKKCLPDCTCGRHFVIRKKCLPDCTCGRHFVSEEKRKKLSAARAGKTLSAEYRKALSEAKIGAPNNRKGKGKGYYDERGYRFLTMQSEHPLSEKKGRVAEHRFVLYSKIGPGQHDCHWCGKSLGWKTGDRMTTICADHLDHNRKNNDPDNLVPSCLPCNWHRGPSHS